jgi:hypothetical protein
MAWVRVRTDGQGAGRLAGGAAALVLAVLVLLGAAPGRPAAAGPGPVAKLAGVWTGQWVADDGQRSGAAEVIVARDVETPTVVAQLTFVDDGVADTVRREGRLTRQGLYFDLVGGGALVLTLESGDRLTGEFAGGPDVPVPSGVLTLTRRARG